MLLPRSALFFKPSRGMTSSASTATPILTCAGVPNFSLYKARKFGMYDEMNVSKCTVLGGGAQLLSKSAILRSREAIKGKERHGWPSVAMLKCLVAAPKAIFQVSRWLCRSNY